MFYGHTESGEGTPFLVYLKAAVGFAAAALAVLVSLATFVGKVAPSESAQYAIAFAGGLLGYVVARSIHDASAGKPK